jgi:peptidoglycan/LPS O-acetylase OafA/YrhL
MVVMGMITGALLFYFGDSAMFPAIHEVPVWKVILYMALGMLLIPVPPSVNGHTMDIRGWEEMHTLDAPCWSLFFEYIANILYALVIRKFSTKAFAVLVFLAGCVLIHLTVIVKGDVAGGWVFNPTHLHIGFTRLFYPFFAGLLLFRIGKLIRLKHAFLLCSLLIIAVLSIPRIGGDRVWMNGLYESFCIILVFPLIVFLGASGELKGKYSSRICKFLGDISYPVYIVNYPIIYIYTGWVSDRKIPLEDALPVALLVFVSCVALAYACLKLYDEPVRKWLKKKL